MGNAGKEQEHGKASGKVLKHAETAGEERKHEKTPGKEQPPTDMSACGRDVAHRNFDVVRDPDCVIEPRVELILRPSTVPVKLRSRVVA